MIRVLIVDDSPFVRRALTRMLQTAPDIEVVGVGVDGAEAIEKVRSLKPDVVTLDIQMPRMDGLEALQRIMAETPVPVLLLSSLTREGANVTMRGLELGAMDFVDKSSVQGNMNLLGLAEELRTKVRAVAGVAPGKLGTPAWALSQGHAITPPPPHPRRAEIVVIGTSTGGPPALQAIIPRLPEGFGAAVLVIQHMPVGFTRSLADRLASRSAVPVREAEDGDIVSPGTTLIAPAGLHLKLKRRGGDVKVWLDEEPRASLHRPSVDVVMSSVAKFYGPSALAILLTGMGSDGVEGMRAIRAAGGKTYAESEESCVIYGMPKAAVEAGVVDRSFPLGRMADEIVGAV